MGREILALTAAVLGTGRTAISRSSYGAGFDLEQVVVGQVGDQLVLGTVPRLVNDLFGPGYRAE